MATSDGSERGCPRVAVIAGPNGSGKSTFYRATLAQQFPVFVNADEISASLGDSVEPQARNVEAAKLAESRRAELMAQSRDFAFETVFSRTEYWIESLRNFQSAGYEVWLFFICTEDPVLNVSRVEARVNGGGHNVPPAKVVSRFSGSIRTAIAAAYWVDQLWLFDNTEMDRSHRLVARFDHGRVRYMASQLPSWALPFLETSLSGRLN